MIRGSDFEIASDLLQKATDKLDEIRNILERVKIGNLSSGQAIELIEKLYESDTQPD